MSEKPLLSLYGVSRSFGALKAVDNVTLEVPKGQVVGLIGPNGSGKTTLINLVSGVLRPQQGRIEFDGREISRRGMASIASFGLGRTFQSPDVYDTLSPLGVCATADAGLQDVRGWTAWTRPWEGKALAAQQALSEVVMPADGVASDLPYGKRKLVDIARCLSAQPKMVLLDEPSSGLNAEEYQALAHQIIKLARNRALTVLIVDHKMPFLHLICSRLICLVAGKIIADGAPDAVERDPDVRRAYFGIAG